MLRAVLGVVFVVGLSADKAPAADTSPFQLLDTTAPAVVSNSLAHEDDGQIAEVQYGYYPYRTYYGGYYNGYRRYPGYYGGYYRPYYTRGWRDGYVFPLGRRWGAF